jgi:hypothetical protein
MQVASAMRQAGFRVQQSLHYTDPTTHKMREVDVVAMAADHPWEATALVHFVLECKASKKPWVLFTSEDTLGNVAPALGHRTEAVTRGSSDLTGVCWGLLGSSIEGRKLRRVGYNLREAHSDNGDRAYDAIGSVVCASLAVLQSLETCCPLRFALPAVVIGAPLVECFVDADGRVRLAQVDEGWLFCSDGRAGQLGTCVRVLSSKALPAYAEEAQKLKAAVFAALASDIKAERKKLGLRP